MIAITKVLNEQLRVATRPPNIADTNYAVANDGTQTIFDPKTGQTTRLPTKVAPAPVVTGTQTVPAQAAAPDVGGRVEVPPIPIPPAAPQAAKIAGKTIRKSARMAAAPQPPAGVPAAPPISHINAPTVSNLPQATTQPVPANNEYIQQLQARVKAGARTGGGENAYQDAVRLAAARRATTAPVQTVTAVHPPPAPIIQPVAPIIQPAPAVNMAKASQAADLSGTQAAGIALKKGAQSAGEAVGSLGNKTMELAGEHPGMAGAAAGVVGALGLRKLLQRNKQPT